MPWQYDTDDIQQRARIALFIYQCIEWKVQIMLFMPPSLSIDLSFSGIDQSMIGQFRLRTLWNNINIPVAEFVYNPVTNELKAYAGFYHLSELLLTEPAKAWGDIFRPGFQDVLNEILKTLSQNVSKDVENDVVTFMNHTRQIRDFKTVFLVAE